MDSEIDILDEIVCLCLGGLGVGEGGGGDLELPKQLQAHSGDHLQGGIVQEC